MNIEHIWAEYKTGLKAFLHSRVSNPSDVDDLLQNILLKTHNNLHTVKSQTSIKSWLYQIANHSIIDFYRERSKRQDLDVEDMWYQEEDADIKQSLALCVEPFIKALPEEEADLLTSVDLNGRSQRDVAEAIGVSYSTLKSRVQKARVNLRGLFETCCHFSVDSKGNIMDFEPKSKNCKRC